MSFGGNDVRRFRLSGAAVLALAAVAAFAMPPQVLAQQTAAAQKKSAGSKSAPPSKSDDSGAPSVGRSRLDVLEQQMIDMQVAIGTLESFGRGGGGGGTVGRSAAAGIDNGRVDALETQVRALSAQVDQLQRQIQQMQQQPARGAAAGAGMAPAAVANAGPQIAPGVQGVPDNDPIGRIIGGGQPRANSAVVGGGAGNAPAAADESVLASNANPKQAYEAAYGYLLSQDYTSAETAFDDFLKKFPNDQLAGNAQYWLGETHFVRGQFKPAAAAFLKGYQTYARSAKAPDSLLKLGLSLERLGQKDAACASFGELQTKFPSAPGHIRQRADGERRRLGCA